MYEKRTSAIVTSNRFSAFASARKDEDRHPRKVVLNPFTRRGGRVEPLANMDGPGHVGEEEAVYPNGNDSLTCPTESLMTQFVVKTFLINVRAFCGA
jgi:hypothetical protein